MDGTRSSSRCSASWASLSLPLAPSHPCRQSKNPSLNTLHQTPRSFWSAPRMRTSGEAQHRKCASCRLPVPLRTLRVKFDKSDWMRIRNEFSAHAQKIGPSERSRFLVLTKRSLWGREWPQFRQCDDTANTCF